MRTFTIVAECGRRLASRNADASGRLRAVGGASAPTGLRGTSLRTAETGSNPGTRVPIT